MEERRVFVPAYSSPSDLEEAKVIQQRLRADVRLTPAPPDWNRIAGIDVSYDVALGISHAFVVLMRRGVLQPYVSVRAEVPTPFPYVPGFLSFREIPAILAALAKLPETPDILMVDGQGVAHPRRFGIAAHLGVLLDLPSLGVAKSRLCGQYAPLAAPKGATQPLTERGEVIGVVLRSKERTNPLFISAGHRIDHAQALACVQECLTRYRLPEPTRIADKLSKDKSPPKPLLL